MIVHAGAVAAGYSLVFGWLFAYAPLHDLYLSESDLFEYYLPIFLAPFTTWSPFEFSGLPAFADPGDFTLYPLHFLARSVGSWTALVASACVLAASFTYAYVYRLTRSWRAAAFAGLAYGLSEALLERTPHLGTMHAFAWLPLILLAIEGVDGASTRRWIAVGGGGVGCCFLAGHPQPAVYTFYAAFAYAGVRGWRTGAARRFYVAVFAMFALGGLLASAKALPLVEASLLMARQIVNFGQFAAHTNSPAQMLSAVFPTVLHEGREAPTYVGLGTLMLAGLGAAVAWRTWRGGYWIGAATIGLLLGMGSSTPLAAVFYAVLPLYDKFRGAGRHLFLFALGAAVLAGLAIDALERSAIGRRAVARAVVGVALLVGVGAVLLAAMPSAFQFEVRAELPWRLPLWNSGVWVQFAVLALSAAAVALLAPAPTRVFGLAVVSLVLLLDTLYSLPYPVSLQGIVPVTVSRSTLQPNAHALQLARDLAPLHQRALATGGTGRDPVVPAAFARLWRVPIAGAYGPMLLDRYSQLAMMGTNGSVRPSLMAGADVALDLLAVRYLIVRPDELAPPPTFIHDGVTWATPSMALTVGRPDCGHAYPRRTTVPLPAGVPLAEVALVTHLACADHLPQGSAVARIAVVGAAGTVAEMHLRAGIETAERALAVEDVRGRTKHAPATIFDDPEQDGGYRYVTRLRLPQPAVGRSLEIAAEGIGGWLTIDRLTLIGADGTPYPYSVPQMWLADGDRWRTVREIRTSRATDRLVDEEVPGEEPLRIIENRRALPRAWVVGEVVPLAEYDAVQTMRHSQLPDGRAFDPRTTAIIDAEATPPGALAPGRASADVVTLAEERVEVDVTTAGPGFLVLSDVWYPGWRATVDGEPAAVYRADVALRGVVVPAGRHRVVFELRSVTWRAGTWLSGVAAAAVFALCLWPTRRRAAAGAGAPAS